MIVKKLKLKKIFLKRQKKKKKLVFHRLKRKNMPKIKILEFNLKENNNFSSKVIVLLMK